MSSSFLLKQLEDSRLQHAIDYVRNNSRGQKHLNSQEVAYINQIITGKKDQSPWRTESSKIKLKSSEEHELSMISNPLILIRDIVTYAHDLLADENIIEAATHIYSKLVLGHFFEDANRRTAALAAYWMIYEKGNEIEAQKLAHYEMGDLRKAGEIKKLREFLKSLV